jgi:integrase
MRGGIRRQGHDTWQIRVYNSAARRREYFTVTGTLKDARDARNRRLAQIAKGSKPPPRRASKVTIQELCSEWLERKRATKEKKTVQQYEWCAKHIFAPRYGLGSALVQTIKVDDVQRFVDSLVSRGLSPKSVKGITSALSQIFKLARRKDLIRFNPTEDVERPSAKPNTVRPPSPRAIWAAIEKAMERGEPDRAAIIRLQAATGMRRGEVAGLRWEDVELDSDPPQLTIERAIADLRGNGNGPPPRAPS